MTDEEDDFPIVRKEVKAVKYFHTGGNSDRVWHIQALTGPDGGDFEELPDDTETPFEKAQGSDISKVV